MRAGYVTADGPAVAWWEQPVRKRGTSECPSCARSNNRGLHRIHDCDGQTVGVHVVVVCDCACRRESMQRIMASGGFPTMALSAFPAE